MDSRHLCRAKRTDNGEWAEGFIGIHTFIPPEESGKETYLGTVIMKVPERIYDCKSYEVDPSTICQCTGLKDKNGKLILENDILMCHGNRNDLVKAVFGEFYVIDADTLEKIDRVIGWHYEVLPTDSLSKCEPFCLSMPLTDEYVKTCEFEVIGSAIDNPELLEVGE